MSEQQQFASLLPGNADQSGFMDGVTATIIEVRASTFDYNGTLAVPVPAIKVTYRPHTEGAKDNVQHYTVGKPEHRAPSEDGRRFMVFGAKKGIPKDSNGLLFLSSLLNAGFPADKIADDLSVFDNTVALLRAEALPKTNEGQKDRQIVLVDKIVTYPWDNTVKATAPKTGTKAAPKAQAASAPAAAPASDEATMTAATEAVMTILAEAKNRSGVAKKDIGTLAFKALSTNPNRNAAVKVLSTNTDAFLKTIAGSPVIVGEDMVGTVAWDGEKLSVAAA